ncbi:hypothetical protein FHG87_018010 [Trinorchestia longiramus]|nr:hypothetical protein FHG87_018010 [Trinorchestia longiramus]
MNDVERQQFLENRRNRYQERRNNMNEERQQFLENLRNRDQERRNEMNEVERQQFLGNRRNRYNERRNDNNMEHQIHYTGAMDIRCKFCGALRFKIKWHESC